ncbi:MAG: phosphotransferase [Gammaproteobacteria bacterium]|nr:phosphotransferase [Gammaproteobacteria bacterium]
MNPEKIIREIDWWQTDIEIQPLEGGITNHNFIVTCTGANATRSTTEDQGSASDSRPRFVVRLGDDIPVHHIFRANEVAAGTAAQAAGLSPVIRYHTKGVLVMDYIPSQALSPEQVREPEMLARIVPLVRRCHQDIPEHLRGAPMVFWVFHVVRDYIASLSDTDSSHLNKLPLLQQANSELEQAASPFDIVFGHNDLLAANLLDDGSRLWLIDWEYAGYNSPLFDLGGLASNNDLTVAMERWLLEAYFEKSVTDELWYRYQAMKTASLLRETLWSMISEVHSTIDFDYSTYSAENLQRFESSLAAFRSL